MPSEYTSLIKMKAKLKRVTKSVMGYEIRK